MATQALPQPAPALPGHHTPVPNGQRYPTPVSAAGNPIGTAVLFEDAEIRLWENRLSPGHLFKPHSHERDYWIIVGQCSDDKKHRIQLHNEEGDWKLMTTQQGPTGSVVYTKRTGFKDEAGSAHIGFETADNPDGNPITVAYLCELKATEPGVSVPALDAPPGWGASAGVIFENTEVKIWDFRVPAGEKGVVPVDKQNNRIFHADVRGKRLGAKVVADLNASDKNVVCIPSPPTHRLFTGTTYYRSPNDPMDAPGAGECFNEGTEMYRGVVVEVKPVEPVLTEKLGNGEPDLHLAKL